MGNRTLKVAFIAALTCTNVALLIGGAQPALAQTTWTVDGFHSRIGFSVRHMMVSRVNGQFDSYTATVKGDPQAPQKAVVEASIDVASINTGNKQRDDHLRSPEFFAASKFPKITFKSTKIEPTGKNAFRIHGKLTMHGITKPIVLMADELSKPVKGMQGETRLGLHATVEVDRQEFGLKWNKVIEAGGLAVGNSVKIELDLELTKK